VKERSRHDFGRLTRGGRPLSRWKFPLLRLVQHIAYGHGLHTIVGRVSFLHEVTAASDLRRFLALCSCGAVAGIGWWLLYRFGAPLVSIRQAVQNGGRMPFWATLTHAILQIVTVGLGSPLGREVAPRELGAAFATKLCARANLTPECTRIIIACGAGAGLAAVYNVPLGGTLFTLEVLLGTFSLPVSAAALATCVIATLVAWLGLGNGLQYSLPPLAVSPSIIFWSLLVGPVIGAAAYLFVRVTEAARARASRLASGCVVRSGFSHHWPARDSISATAGEWKGAGTGRI
jgi:H+/Cl- antiporter ClcA